MPRKPKFRPEIFRIRLNPEQAVLTCQCYDAGPACLLRDIRKSDTYSSYSPLCLTGTKTTVKYKIDVCDPDIGQYAGYLVAGTHGGLS